MIEKNVAEANQAKKERFEFILKINGNIVCQRYFRINGFKERSIGSYQVSKAVESCVRMIDKDLKEKTRIFNWYTAPQVFKDEEQMENWLEKYNSKMEVPSYVLIEDTEKVFVWDSEKLIPYDKPFNSSEYINGDKDQTQTVLTFVFAENGNEVSSYSWSGNYYSKFVRNNIDISNSRNKYSNNEIYAPVEEFIMDKFIASQDDLIPHIVRSLCIACTMDAPNAYWSRVRYGDRKYELNLRRVNNEYFKSMERKYRKKTEEYYRYPV